MPCNLIMHLSLASYGNRLVMEKARTHQNAILVKKIKHLKFNNISHLKQPKFILKPTISLQSLVNQGQTAVGRRSIEVSKLHRQHTNKSRHYSQERQKEDKLLQRSLTNRTCQTIKPQHSSLHFSQRSNVLVRMIRKTKSINLTLSVEQQQNQKFTCRLWKQSTTVNGQSFTVEVLRCKNDYLLSAVWEKEPTDRYQVRVDEAEGSKLLTQIDYDYLKLCTMLSFLSGVLCLDFQLRNDSQIHHYRFRKRRLVLQKIEKAHLKCETSPFD